MLVNNSKTQMVCISANTASVIKSYIRIDDEEIQSTDELKLLGFWFGNRPNADVHVSKLAGSFRSKLWALRKLRRAGMDCHDMLIVYKSVLRSVLDFVAPTYHPLLNKTQTNLLEQLQRRALKVVFGYSESYSDCLIKAKITTLEERRFELTKNFAIKTAKNPRFSDGWFPEKPKSTHNTRYQKKYVEVKPRTERFKHNPLTYMRKLLNDL